MKKSMIALALAGAFTMPAFAQTSSSDATGAPPATTAEPAGPHTFTGNMTIASDYRFRGISQTMGKPAIQGGVDYSHESGVYVGNWNSNVSEYAGYPGGNIEMDFYGGWKKSFGDFGIDLGGLYYYYPGSKVGGTGNAVDNFELYIGASWKFVTFKYSHALTDYFDLPDTKNSQYFDLSANYDLGDGWGIVAHAGYTNVSHSSAFDYADWKLGVTKDIGGWLIGLAYVDTDASGSVMGDPYRFMNTSTGKEMNAGRATAVLSVTKTF